MHLSSVSDASATIELSRAEVLALSNLLLHAQNLPLELRGPGEIFVSLSEAFDGLRDRMTA
ncbi:hypothetical protein ACFX43_16850 [Nocardioides sp. YIM B13467]|uniref:hypothetical protein n=1 Tax=Nocardioides sp. YIM B13467 TaxID=3366294 RepID=UPI003671E0C2